MRQFEIRTKDLKTVLLSPGCISEGGARDWHEHYRNVLNHRDCVLVLHEFESPAEADAARLDYVQANPLEIASANHGGKVRWYCGALSKRFDDYRKAIDAARQAPQPTVRVIATPKSLADPT